MEEAVFIKRILSLILATITIASYTASAYAVEVCPSVAYADVSGETGWAHTSIDFVLSEGLMVGVGNNRFAPKTPATRAMLATVLYRIVGSPEWPDASSFKDIVKDSWYEKATNWAYSAGVVSGYSATAFGPNDFLTREQAVTMLYNFAQTCGYSYAEISLFYSSRALYEAYSDFNQVSSWAVPAMKWALDTGIVSGTGTEEAPLLSPKAITSREQLAAMLYRFDHILKWPGKGNAVGTEENRLRVSGLLDSPSFVLSDADAEQLKQLFSDTNWEKTDLFLEYPATYSLHLGHTEYYLCAKDGAWLPQCSFILTQKNGEKISGSMTATNNGIFQKIIDICQTYTPE